jgi:hypothetical protein
MFALALVFGLLTFSTGCSKNDTGTQGAALDGAPLTPAGKDSKKPVIKQKPKVPTGNEPQGE